MPLSYKKSSGFSLIELLVVISIIGALAAFSLVSFSTTQKQARDAERKSDMKQYQTMLAAYAGKNKGLYPERYGVVNAFNILCPDLGFGSSCPADPQTSNTAYRYCSDGSANVGTPTATRYAVWAALESTSTATNFVICSNGKAGESASAPGCGAAFSCPIP